MRAPPPAPLDNRKPYFICKLGPYEPDARRRGMGLSGMEHWLAPNLAYERQ